MINTSIELENNTQVKKNPRPIVTIQYHNNASKIQHILPNNSHFIQKQNELLQAIEKSNLPIREIFIAMDTIVHMNSSTRYICKLQFNGSGLPSFIATKESERYLDIAIANLDDAIKYIRDLKEKITSERKTDYV
jgi:hypothetical protein